MRKLFSPVILGIAPAFIIVWVVLGIVFKAHPEWDIAFSHLFYTNGTGFLINDKNLFGNVIYRGVHYATAVLIAFYVIYLVIAYVKKKETFLGISRKTILYMAIVLALGPGLVVNFVLKEHIGRARPANVEYFESEKAIHTPAFTFSNQCKSNCSFVSGHASFGYYWVVLGFIAATATARCKGIAFGVFMGVGIGLVRIMQGRHFLSDVIFAFFFVYAVAAIVHYFMYVRTKKE